MNGLPEWFTEDREWHDCPVCGRPGWVYEEDPGLMGGRCGDCIHNASVTEAGIFVRTQEGCLWGLHVDRDYGAGESWKAGPESLLSISILDGFEKYLAREGVSR